VCVLHSVERLPGDPKHVGAILNIFKIFYNNSNCIYELYICASVG